MRIAFLIPNLGVRGSVRRVVELSNHLMAFGHEVSVYHSDGSPCAWLPLAAPTYPESAVLDDDCDALIHFTSALHLAYACAAPCKARFLYVLGIDEAGEAEIRRQVQDDGVQVDSTAAALRGAHRMQSIRLLANCTALARWAEACFGRPCACIPGGVDRAVFHPRQGPRQSGLILAGGARRAIEGTAEAVEVGERIRTVVSDAKLEFYAYQGYSQEQLGEQYSRAAVFLDAQRRGGWNNAVAEAMASGTPVVCTDIWGNRDFAVHKRTAWVVPVGDVDAMLRGVHRLLVDGEFAARLAANALEAIRPYTWDRAARALEAAIVEALNE